MHRIAIPVPTSADLEYNRRSWPMYAEAVRQAGGTPVEVDLRLSARELHAVAKECEGVLLPGSPADVDPSRYGQDAVAACAPADKLRENADRILLEEAYVAGKPVLGICYGAQSLNVWRGGSLFQDVGCKPVNHSAGAGVGVAHTACLWAGGLLDRITAMSERSEDADQIRLPVNSSHHQAVDQPGDGLRVAAVSLEDGVIEAIETGEVPDSPWFVLGVQWHPERSLEISVASRAIFGSFIEAVIAWERQGARVR